MKGENDEKFLRASLRQALQGRGFFLAFLGAALVVLLAAFEGLLGAFRSEQLLSYGYHHTLILSDLSAEGMALACAASGGLALSLGILTVHGRPAAVVPGLLRRHSGG